ncbi:MAG: HIT domain-containing protein [Syntrophobacter sp.]
MKQSFLSDLALAGFHMKDICGESAGQTAPHAHIHLIPRRNGDTANPRGSPASSIGSPVKSWRA